MPKLKKPESVAADPFRSAKWDELTAGRDFAESDAPTVALLCSWYQVVERCMADIDVGGGVQVAYQNDLGDIKALPQLATMKQASAEIRQLCKQLGITGAREAAQGEGAKVTPLEIIRGGYRGRLAGADVRAGAGA